MRGLGLVVKTFWSPGPVFQEVAETGVRPWAAVLLQAGVGAAVAITLTLSVDLDDILQAQARQTGQEVTQEQRENLTALAANPIFQTLGIASALGSGALGTVFVLAAVSGVYYAIFLVLGATAGYGRFFALTSFAFMPTVVSGAVNFLLIVLSPTSPLDPALYSAMSPAIFITLDAGEAVTPMFAIARSLNLVSFWILILLGMAYRRVAPRRTSNITVAVVVVIPWLAFVAARVGWTVLLS